MRKLVLSLLFIFTCAWVQAQVNYVINGDLEKYSECPTNWNQIYYANGWRNARDSTLEDIGMEYYNVCSNSRPDKLIHVPINSGFIQYPHSGNGMAGATLYYDKKPSSPGPPEPLPSNYRDYLQGHLSTELKAGKGYCVSFYVNMTEASVYGQNKIGAYLDDGLINVSTDTPGAEILTVVPQVYTDDIIIDTEKWVKIEGSFIATGTESMITIGNFFSNSSITTMYTNYWLLADGYSYYLIDDISVVETDLSANAGPDTYVEETKTVQIGRVGDTTANAIDCKWYHKGTLIDSGAIISVHAAAAKGIIDTYVVVQTICGSIKTDTVLVSTVGLGLKEQALKEVFHIYPNPTKGQISWIGPELQRAVVYDLTGRTIMRFEHPGKQLSINLATGTYVLELFSPDGQSERQRITITE